MLKPYKKGTKLPEHVEHLYKRFNPTQKQIDAGNNPWTEVQVDTDPEAVVIATGYDAMGRFQRLYSATHSAGAKQAKFERVRNTLAEWSSIGDQINEILASDETNAKDYEAFLIARLIYETGIRPGGEASARGENSQSGTKTFGATTLQLRHVKPCPRGVRLQFIGKKGVPQNILVTNELLVAEMIERKQSTTSYTTPLFDVSAAHLRTVFKRLGSGDYSPKDFRTALGTSIALDILGSRVRWPKTKKGRKQVVNDALDRVAKQLGNTRAVSRSAYVDPAILEEFVPDHNKPKE